MTIPKLLGLLTLIGLCLFALWMALQTTNCSNRCTTAGYAQSQYWPPSTCQCAPKSNWIPLPNEGETNQ